MSVPFKPPGYSTVSPYLIVAGAQDTIAFLERVFNAVEKRRFTDESGKIAHAEVLIGDSVVMLAQGGEGWPPVPSHVHIYVADVDTTYKLALEAGGISVQEPMKKDDADKRCGVRDSGGTTWWIATMVE